MFLGDTNNAQSALAANEFAFNADWLYGSSNLHTFVGLFNKIERYFLFVPQVRKNTNHCRDIDACQFPFVTDIIRWTRGAKLHRTG